MLLNAGKELNLMDVTFHSKSAFTTIIGSFPHSNVMMLHDLSSIEVRRVARLSRVEAIEAVDGCNFIEIVRKRLKVSASVPSKSKND